jgi:RNA polymerase sigma-70 factor, ECF subfamily
VARSLLRRPQRDLGEPAAMAIDPANAPDHPQPAWPSSHAEFAALVEEYADRLARSAFRQLGNLHDAEDIVQDVFVRVFKGGRPGHAVSIGAYLYRAVRFACTDRLRRRARTVLVHDQADFDHVATKGQGPLEAAEAAEEIRRVDALLERLPEKQAEAIRLRVFDGLRLDEIAEILECPIDTVSSRLRYGFQKLRETMGRRGTDS